jgi:hypothetical protein
MPPNLIAKTSINAIRRAKNCNAVRYSDSSVGHMIYLSKLDVSTASHIVNWNEENLTLKSIILNSRNLDFFFLSEALY